MLKNRKGVVLIAVYIVIAVLMIFAAAFFARSYNENKIAERHQLSAKAMALAESGIERAVFDLRQDFIQAVTPPSPSWRDGLINGLTCPANDQNFYAMPYTSTQLGEGSYMVELKNVEGQTDHIWVRSTGTVENISKTILTYIKIDLISIWDNAVSAGTGSPGDTVINGNVDIRGSVHLFGEDLFPGDTAIAMSGGAHIGNNYKNIPSDLGSRIPALDTVLFNGEDVESLEAKVRVKQGIIQIDGSANIGDPDIPGNTYKETVDGVYVTDGFTGNIGVINVYSDNGTANPYDLGTGYLDFPSMYDPYDIYPNYVDYLKTKALVISDQADLDELAAITPTSLFNIQDPLGKGSISMDGNGNLSINGIVIIDGGNLAMNKQGTNKTILYTGIGTIAVIEDAGVGGDVDINLNLLTSGQFPNNILGVMTTKSITFNSAQIDVMGVFYAEDTITSEKQTRVAGVFVSNYCDMGNQVPSIFQVPQVATSLPPGMIGATPTWYIRIVAWQEK